MNNSEIYNKLNKLLKKIGLKQRGYTHFVTQNKITLKINWFNIPVQKYESIRSKILNAVPNLFNAKLTYEEMNYNISYNKMEFKMIQ